jgi:DNA-binding CsgD family transcriptional regulator
VTGEDASSATSLQDPRQSLVDMAVVGRDEEIEKIRAHVLDRDRLPARCRIVGEAGSGKTTVWRAIVEDARERGHRVLSAAGSEAEWQLSLGAARDLVADVIEDIERDLPPPQRRHLRVMLLLEEPGDLAPDPGALAVAFRGLIRAAAARGPVLIAVDDVQWLDPASVALLSYALRRLSTEPVGVLFAQRDGPPNQGDPLTTPGDDRDLEIRLGPLTLGALGAVLRDNLAVPVARPTLRRIHDVAAGNPLLAIELGRVLTDPDESHPPGAPLPVPASVAELLRARLGNLDRRTREALGILAALASPEIGVLETVLGRDPMADLAPAVDAAILDLSRGGIRFRHPLLASIAYELLGPVRQGEIHRRLGDLLVDPEERARHIALGVEAPDEVAAAIVEEGAGVAFGRGSPSAAADLAYHAGRLTPQDFPAARHRRVLLEIDGAFAAGETARAAARLDAQLTLTEPGRDRAELLARRARLHSFADDIASSIDGLLEALSEAGDDDALRRAIEEGLAWGLMLVRRDLAGSLVHARSAADLARRAGNAAALAESLATQALAECLTGRPWRATIDAALALEPTLELLPATRRPGFAYGCCLTCVGDLDGARTVFEGLAAHAIAHGDEALLPSILNRLVRVELQAGRWAAAGTNVEEGISRATESGHGPSIASLLGKRAVLAAFRGDHDQARSDADRALELAVGSAFDPATPERAVARGGESALWALGHVALVEGQPERAVYLLEPMTRVLVAAGVTEPGEMPWLLDLGEASVLTARLDVARTVIHLFEAVAANPDRGADAVIADHLRALLDTANGDHTAARDRLLAARGRLANLDRPFESARTDLALGGVQRRLRERRAARASLERTRAAFLDLGSVAWAERATTELARVGGRAPAGDGLTPTERAVAELVARGRTNRETAAALFLSVHTVEAALTAVYGKLGVRSRTELARRIDESSEVIS